MLNNNVYYHGSIRKAIVGFGRLFSSIYIDRKQGDSVNGQTAQRLQIPITYAPKEKWLVRIDQQPDIENNVTMVTLPRMSFEITGYNYDASRKANRMNKITTATTDANNMRNVYTPVPYNVDISLYVITKTQEDGMQIIEQILPTFTPEYTLQVDMIPELGIVNSVPVILNSVSVLDEYDGDFQDRRYVTHTLDFQMKLNLYGPVSGQGVITHVDANIGQNKDFTHPNRVYTADGNIIDATVSQENWEFNF